MTVMAPLVSTLRNAYESRDNSSFYPALDKVQELLLILARTPTKNLDPSALENRRNELHVELAAVNDRLQGYIRTRRAQVMRAGQLEDDGIQGFHADVIHPPTDSLDPSS